MRITLVRAPLLVLCATLAVTISNGQPPKGTPKIPKTPYDRPDYTAFPDLKAVKYKLKQIKNPDGTTTETLEEEGGVPLPQLPKLAAGASPLRKVQYEQAQAGLAYLVHAKRTQLTFGPMMDFTQMIGMIDEVYRSAAELEEAPAQRVVWYETSVREFKDLESVFQNRVQIGTASPQSLYCIRFKRLRAEADLLKLKEEVEKAKK